MRKILIILSIVVYSNTASAGMLSQIWDSLRTFLGLDITRTVNESVTPPGEVCSEAQGDRPTSNYPEQPQMGASPIFDEVPEEGDEKEIGFSQKDDTDADELREQLKTNYKKLGGDPTALEQALCFYDKNRGVNFDAAGDPSRLSLIHISEPTRP